MCILIMRKTQDVPRTKKIRFKFALFLLFCLIPFMLIWNLYGNFMIKQEYFKVSKPHSAVVPLPKNQTIDPSSNASIPTNQSIPID